MTHRDTPSDASAPALPPLTIGSVIREALTLYRPNALVFFVIYGLLGLPGVLLELLLPTTPYTPLALAGTAVVLGALGPGAATIAVFETLHGRQAGVGACLRAGLNNWLRVLGVFLVGGLLVVIGLVLLVVPGVIAMSLLAIAAPVATREGAGVGTALRRSADLVEGHRGEVIGVLVFLGFLPGFALTLLEWIAARLVGRSVAAIALLPFNIILGGICATALVVLYYRLRSMNDAIPVELM